jgi:hypothetical protein
MTKSVPHRGGMVSPKSTDLWLWRTKVQWLGTTLHWKELFLRGYERRSPLPVLASL